MQLMIMIKNIIDRFGKLSLLGFLTFLLVVGCSGKEQSESAPSKIIARVNGETITSEDLSDSLKMILAAEAMEELSPPELSDLKKNLLGELIEKELILREAGKRKISVSEEELSGEVSLLRENYDDEAFEKVVLPKYTSMASWEEDVRKNLLIKKVIEGVRDSAIVITDKMASEYYKKNIAEYDIPEQVRARMILSSTKKEATEAKKRLRKEKFSAVATELSQGPEAANGGDLGFFGRGDMPKEFEDAVFSLKPGVISDVVATPYGYHIFLVEEKKVGRKLKFKDVKEAVKKKLEEEKADMEFRKWMLSLKKNSNIEILEEL
ncbi:MAG: peptidylprolyl isomerase [Thermodesulfobacteriota bacterium]